MEISTPVESMAVARMWLSVGAGAAGLLLPLAYLVVGFGLNLDLFSLFITVLLLILAIVVAMSGASFLCKVGPRALNSFPPPLLVTLGFILGALIVAVGAIYVGFRVLGELASAL